jgi:hypothetical protein
MLKIHFVSKISVKKLTCWKLYHWKRKYWLLSFSQRKKNSMIVYYSFYKENWKLGEKLFFYWKNLKFTDSKFFKN